MISSKNKYYVRSRISEKVSLVRVGCAGVVYRFRLGGG